MFGNKINVIDFLVLLFILCLTPAGFFSYKIMTRPQVQEVQAATDYTIIRRCPICDAPIAIKIELGQRPERYYKVTCPNCHNNVKIWRKR